MFRKYHKNSPNIKLEYKHSVYIIRPRMLLIVDLKSFGSMPNLTEMLETSEQLLIADNFLCISADNFLDCLRAITILEIAETRQESLMIH